VAAPICVMGVCRSHHQDIGLLGALACWLYPACVGWRHL
jgi:hypothetical protein